MFYVVPLCVFVVGVSELCQIIYFCPSIAVINIIQSRAHK
jgi:hypothetical protein